MESYFAAWRKFFQFGGRSSRKEYWTFVIVNAVVYVLLGMLGRDAGHTSRGDEGNVVQALFWLLVVVPTLAVTVRRLHDTNRTGLLALLLIIPCFGPFVLLFFNIQEGDIGENQYGPDPYDTGNPRASAGYDRIIPLAETLPQVDGNPSILVRPIPDDEETIPIFERGVQTEPQYVTKAKVERGSGFVLEKPRDQHYAFAHVYLRDKAFSNPATTVHELVGGNSSQYLKILWKTVGLRTKAPDDEFISAEGLECHPFWIGDQYRAVIIKFPEPLGPAEAFMVAMVIPATAEPGDQCLLRYITLEFSPNRLNRTVLAEWIDGGHVNRGDGPEPEVAAFRSAVVSSFENQ